MNSEPITKQEIDGKTYFSTVSRGVEYCASFTESVGEWFVATHRLALGKHVGGGKYYKNIGDCKVFAALPVLMEIGAI